MTAKTWEGRAWRVRAKRRKTRGCGKQCSDCRGGSSIRGLNDNGKNTIKII